MSKNPSSSCPFKCRDVYPRWQQTEKKATAKRVEKCNETLHKLLGGTPSTASAQKHPRVGMAFSGGGWRAMMSAVALMDGLSTPLAKDETVSGEEGIKLMDVITHIFGLSGGSWASFVSLAGGERNPFHHNPLDRTPMGNADRAKHPWLHGQQNKFDSDVHTYEGLKFIMDPVHVSQACYRGGAATRFVCLSSNVADTTFGTTLATSLLGATLVERWSNFLANDILSFKDYGELKMPTSEAEKASKASAATLEDITAEELEAAENGSGDALQAVNTAVIAAAEVASKDPNIGTNARNIKLSDLRGLIERGDFPFVANTAIADIPGVDIEGRVLHNNSDRLYNWIEISPFFVRNVGTGDYTEDVDNVSGYFLPPSAPNRKMNEMRLHNMMAICGSAFACDVGAVLPKGVSNAIRDTIKLKSSPILGGGLTDIIYGKQPSDPVNTCRDAGIDFNVPFPPLLSEADREFDIIIAMDAGADSTNAYELARAAELGYLMLQFEGTNPLDVFPKGNRVRVYRCVNGGPSIIYFLGLTTRATSKIIHKEDQVLNDTAAVRQSVLDELIPILLSELRIRMSNQLAADGQLRNAASVADFGVSCPSPVKFSSVNRRTAGVVIGGGDDETSRADQLSSNSSAVVSQQSASMMSVASPVGMGRRLFNSLAESIIVSAAGFGLLRHTIDSFFVVERSVVASLPKAERRVMMIAVLEEEAVAVGSGKAIDTPLKDRIAAVGVDLVEVLAEMGVLRRVNWNNVLSRKVELVEEWAEFYMTTCLARSLLPQFRLDPPTVTRILKLIQREDVPSTAPNMKNVEHIFVTTTLLKATGRMCMLFGSLVAKIARQGCDLSSTASRIVSRRYLTHLSTDGFEPKNIRDAVKGPTAYELSLANDDLELAVMKLSDHIVDFFSEMLSFDDLNSELALSKWDVNVLVAFVTCIRDTYDQLGAAHHTSRLSVAGHGLLLAEAVARHPHDRSVLLLRVLAGTKASNRAFGQLPHMGTSTSIDPSGSIGIVACAVQSPNLRRHDEDIIRIVGASYESNSAGQSSAEGAAERRKEVEAIIEAIPRNPHVVSTESYKVTSTVAYRNCFPAAVKELLIHDGFDNSSAVPLLLACRTHYSLMNRRQRKREALFALWSYGVQSHEFRDLFATQCIANGEYHDFLASYVKSISVPSGATEGTVDELLAFAEKYREYVKKVVAVNEGDVTKWSSDLQLRYERINSVVLNTALEVKDAVTDKAAEVAGKVGNVVGTLGLGLRGFLSRKK